MMPMDRLERRRRKRAGLPLPASDQAIRYVLSCPGCPRCSIHAKDYGHEGFDSDLLCVGCGVSHADFLRHPQECDPVPNPLKRLRLHEGMTQPQFSDALGVTRDRFCQAERDMVPFVPSDIAERIRIVFPEAAQLFGLGGNLHKTG